MPLAGSRARLARGDRIGGVVPSRSAERIARRCKEGNRFQYPTRAKVYRAAGALRSVICVWRS
jgi:hypothetical protein